MTEGGSVENQVESDQIKSNQIELNQIEWCSDWESTEESVREKDKEQERCGVDGHNLSALPLSFFVFRCLRNER